MAALATSVGSGLLAIYHLSLNAMRLSTAEMDNYLVSLAETSASFALAGMAYYWSSSERRDPDWRSIACVVVQFGLCVYVRKKYVTGRRYTDADLSGKVYIVTGANAGIGLETCKQLVRMGATVVMACRSAERAKEARQAIVSQISCAPSKVRSVLYARPSLALAETALVLFSM